MMASAEAIEGRARSSRWLMRSAFFVGLAVFVVHFAATALYVAPLNPLKLWLLAPLRGYIEPYFGQGWQLFAPDPLVKSPFLIVQCRFSDFSGSAPRESEPLRVSDALYTLHHQYRVTPALRLRRMQTGALALTNPLRDPLTDAIVSLGTSDDEKSKVAAEAAEARLRENRARGEQVFRRVASAECARRFRGAHVHEVRASVVRVGPPRFSERLAESGAPTVDRVDFDWAPFASDVSSY